MISITIPGRPKTKRRPRVIKKGKRTWSYTPEDTKKFEEMVGWLWRAKTSRETSKNPIKIEIKLFTDRKYTPKQCDQPFAHLDWDNGAKAIVDSLEGLAYFDDIQIVDARVTKEISTEPRTEITLEEVR